MFFKGIAFSLVVLALMMMVGANAFAQNATAPAPAAQASPDNAQQQEEKAKLEAKATVLLEQVLGEAQALKLPENRIRVQIVGGDLLWDRNPARARSLFSDAGAMLGQMMLEMDRTDRGDMQMLNQLRSDLVLTAARHDGDLAYQLLHSTQQPPTANPGNGRRFRPDLASGLEERLLSTIAASDPKLAYQKTVESLDKGDYPSALAQVLAQLQTKDEEAFKKLSDKALSKLSSDSLLANRNAAAAALGLLRPGPRPESTSSATSTSVPNASPQVLSQTTFHDLLDNAITAALTTAPRVNNNQNNQNQRRGMRGNGVFMIGSASDLGPVQVYTDGQNSQTPADPAQVAQNNARMLLMSLQALLPQIDQYLPERAAAVRQKLTEVGVGNNPMASFGNQMRAAMQQGDSDSLATAAASAPAGMQPMLYRQAAQKAIDEGKLDQASQIASDHLDESSRSSIMQAIDFKRLTITASPEKLDEIKQKLAALPSDSDRVKSLVELAAGVRKDNPKLALKFLEDARSLVTKRATNYDEFSDQLKVAEAFASVDPKRSVDVLTPGISQLNELLSAAQVLNGFEVDVFKEGELSLRNNSELVGMISRFGEELASLAKFDFEAARTTADQFQFSEPRMNAKLLIVQNVLGGRTINDNNNGRRLQNFQFVMR